MLCKGEIHKRHQALPHWTGMNISRNTGNAKSSLDRSDKISYVIFFIADIPESLCQRTWLLLVQLNWTLQPTHPLKSSLTTPNVITIESVKYLSKYLTAHPVIFPDISKSFNTQMRDIVSVVHQNTSKKTLLTMLNQKGKWNLHKNTDNIHLWQQ